mmetsp:Transcript_50855/g.99705  ORF Transcript_50855/g.99705 Transcript_50855/m.99705 type:complete len:724 (+) Transcript_50855:98-2269(+)|eukprot:CAMPEP_0175140310 /NCGR_PEP_ID=MMETSP0087-20121206/11396_1 /TAXON_ID=136419 /ORGANISM="Unknown Unknown, Strain D1" /LENGTH=723 /DNA_ID=CAMNT_0016423435 /DNA_START=98 /DNA_END=2269 /DNA_ORIENTATION=-
MSALSYMVKVSPYSQAGTEANGTLPKDTNAREKDQAGTEQYGAMVSVSQGGGIKVELDVPAFGDSAVSLDFKADQASLHILRVVARAPEAAVIPLEQVQIVLPVLEPKQYQCISSVGLRVRDAPNTSAGTIGVLKPGAVVSQTDRQGDFIKISAPDGAGWCLVKNKDGTKKFLKLLVQLGKQDALLDINSEMKLLKFDSSEEKSHFLSTLQPFCQAREMVIAPTASSGASPATQSPCRPTLSPAAETTPLPSESSQSSDSKDKVSSTSVSDSETTKVTRSSSSESISSSKDEEKIEDPVKFELTYDMMLGIRTTVGRAEARAMKKLSASDHAKTNRIPFPAKGSRSTPGHNQRDFYFKDYAPETFRRIRARMGIDPQDYTMSVCGDFEYLEFASNSKSGEWFFFSHDKRYMVKTISHDEARILITMLPKYFDHLMKYPDTLLTRFYGLHKVIPAKGKGGRSCYFIVMGSVFFTDKRIDTIFDLKGSTLGRSATPKEKASGGCVYKDNDFLEMGTKLKIGPANSKRLLDQLKEDCQVLRDMKIMDYSLLLGVHRTTPQPQPVESVPFEVGRGRTNSIRPVDLGFSAQHSAVPPQTPEKGVDQRSASPAASSSSSSAAAFPFDSSKANNNNIASVVLKHTDYTKEHAQHMPNVARGYFTGENGDGFPGDGEFYFFGIIDILICYGFKKKFETKFKSMKHDVKTISAVDPNLYADRFLEFIRNAVE